ncbi:MAG: S8 family serine peptidase [bacterium]
MKHDDKLAVRLAMILATFSLLSACADSSSISSSGSARAPSAAPLRLSSGVPAPGRYIVVLKNDLVSASAVDAMAAEYPGEVTQRYHAALNGLAMSLGDADLTKVRNDPRVAYVEQDAVFSVATTQTSAPWGVDRIDQRALPLNSTYTYAADGSGVTVYILDTGINYSHTEYAGRAFPGIDEITPGGNASDCFGHGTSVAGLVGGTTYGVAKRVRMVSVRVLDCTGHNLNSSIIAGVDWVTANRTLPAVANMSIQGGFSSALNQAIQNSIARGVTFAVAAGNHAADACTESPGSTPGAIAAGATDITDGFASFSDFGSCVALNAPGANITTSAFDSSNSAITTGSGTSFSAPHVAGAAALYLQLNPSATPAQVRAALISNATPNVVAGAPPGTPNLLLYTGFIGGGGGGPAPVANFTWACPTLQCTLDAASSTGSLVSYSWNWGNGRGETRSTPTAKNTWAAPGTYAVTLTVTDGSGRRASMVKQVPVPNQAPAASIASPTNAAAFAMGTPVSFSGSGIDVEDGTLSGASLTWTSSIDGVIGTGTAFSTTSLSTGTHTITLTAKDALGATGTATRSIKITSQQGTPPVARFTWTCQGSVPHQCTFDGSGSTGITPLVNYRWAWGDSRSESHPTSLAKNSWPSQGTFTVTLTVTDASGLSASAARVVAVP